MYYLYPLAAHAPHGAPQNNENFYSAFYTLHTAGEEGRLTIDLGSDYFEKRHQEAIVRQTVRKLENLGFTVILASPEAS
ncbi:hypothetical protein E5161_00355 [Cohnella pontilimi]|uniref:Uncharacterized protein n=1 Tax=Cohnella pontilimi TaxID=2564100 RepID=A0A4U0FG57_9BACL|nr:hypothetical protein E5161_00355 [Cohnella pontilimi]